MNIKLTKIALATCILVAITMFTLACKVESAAASDDTSSGGGGGTAPITVTVDGGANYTVASDGTADVPDPTARAGYDFLGWTKTKDGNSVDFVSKSTPVTTSITIYPIWDTALSSKITFTKDFTTFHAFQYQITIDSLKADTNLEFIASSSATDPGYNNIKDDGALRSAFFTPTFLKRGVYFSFKNGGDYDANKYPVLITRTGIYEPTNNINYINLKNKTQQADIQTAIESVSPALLSPGGTYYIHVYRNGTYVTASAAITLPIYPTTWPTPVASGTNYDMTNYLLGRNDFHYSTSNIAETTNTMIEGNIGDILGISLTLVFPIISPYSACGTDITLNYSFYNPNFISFLSSKNYPFNNDLGQFPVISFVPHTQFGTSDFNYTQGDRYYVMDVLYPLTLLESHNGGYIANSALCYPVSSINNLSNITSTKMKVYDK